MRILVFVYICSFSSPNTLTHFLILSCRFIINFSNVIFVYTFSVMRTLFSAWEKDELILLPFISDFVTGRALLVDDFLDRRTCFTWMTLSRKISPSYRHTAKLRETFRSLYEGSCDRIHHNETLYISLLALPFPAVDDTSLRQLFDYPNTPLIANRRRLDCKRLW